MNDSGDCPQLSVGSSNHRPHPPKEHMERTMHQAGLRNRRMEPMIHPLRWDRGTRNMEAGARLDTHATHMIPAHTCTYAQHTPAGSMHMSHTHQTHACTHTDTLTPHPDITDRHTDTQKYRHITLRGTPAPRMHRPTETHVTFHGLLNRELPRPAVLGHIPGRPSLTPGLIRSQVFKNSEN